MSTQVAEPRPAPPSERPSGTGWLTPARAGWAGVALGFLALFVTVPPALVRSPVPTLVLGVAGLAAGAWALRGGEKRLGWAAILAAVAGVAIGVGATKSGEGNLRNVVAWSALFAAMLRYATPLLFAALGGVMSERSGVINIGLEGMMLMGAFFGAWGADITGSWVLGLIIGMTSGVLLAMIHAVFAISLRADQIVSGFSMNLLALGITGYFYVSHYGEKGTPDDLPRTPEVNLPGIKDIPFFGDIFGQLNILIWLGLLTVLFLWILLFRTAIGLRIRSVGENPLAAETAGLSPMRIRYRAVAASGALAAAGGAYLSIGFVGSFSENMTAGKGFIGLAVMICGRWMPQGALVFALLFGFFTALATRLPTFSPSAATLFQALPYVITLITVAGLVGRSIPPAADGRPLDR
jgi:simple sugar transport system permease protein